VTHHQVPWPDLFAIRKIPYSNGLPSIFEELGSLDFR